MSAEAYSVDVRAMGSLSVHELYALLRMRVDVFVVEQACPYPELDGRDADALHLRLMQGEALLASARLLAPADPDGAARIGRVVVSPAHRGRRLGEALMREAIAACGTAFPRHGIALSAQAHLQAFYEGFGFVATSDVYLEDDIPHVDMLRARPSAAGTGA